MVKVKDKVSIPLSSIDGAPEFVTFDGLDKQHIALVFGEPHTQTAPLVRVHSECLTGEVFGSKLCDCGPQLNEAKQRMATEGGVLLYLRQEGRGIGLYAKLSAYRLQAEGADTFEANQQLHLPEDARSFEPAAQMLKALNITHIRLLSNNPDKAEQLQQYGITVTDIIPTGVYENPHNRRYLEAKINKKSHHIQLP